MSCQWVKIGERDQLNGKTSGLILLLQINLPRSSGGSPGSDLGPGARVMLVDTREGPKSRTQGHSTYVE
jgi:hypothetical protein